MKEQQNPVDKILVAIILILLLLLFLLAVDCKEGATHAHILLNTGAATLDCTIQPPLR